METLLLFLRVFFVGGIICVIGQVLLAKTNMTTGRILALFVVSGVVLTALGLYEPLIQFGRSGATVPLPGFGYSLAKGVETAVAEKGLIGAFTGGLTATSAGIAAAVFFGYANALFFNPKTKK
ncbi:stage V sporulation protein AE [Eubacteriales bacterium OttesenSCG-928-M02]|nr:stage V sporulation protein AE [Eubacteriales bacterium OttesenSCG-928-M02]